MPAGETPLIWSCGGGTQSAAIAALIVRGDLPKPAVAVIADTGREASSTWRYYSSTLQPELARVGVDLVRLEHSFDGSGWNTVDLYGGADKDTPLMPMFTRTGQVRKYCSNEWKSRPAERYLRSIGISSASIMIGYSIDELHRMRHSEPGAKWRHVYPLVDLRMTRADCIATVARMGWPEPPRSSCWMCPYRSDDEWRLLRDQEPEDFAKAVELERDVKSRDSDLWLHRSAVPLDRVDFDTRHDDLFEVPCTDGCFT